jgi:hypothetical protein
VSQRELFIIVMREHFIAIASKSDHHASENERLESASPELQALRCCRASDFC